MKDNLLLIANIILMGTCIISCVYSFIVSFITALWEAYGNDCKGEYKKCFISFFLMHRYINRNYNFEYRI